MIRRSRFLELALVVAALGAGTRAAAGQCIAAPETTPPFLPDGHKTSVLVRYTAGFLPDAHSSRPNLLYTPRGQVAVVEEVEGPGGKVLAPDSTVTIVRWRIGAEIEGCGWVPTRDSLAVGSRHLLRGKLRPDSLWIAGRPTLDLYPERFADMALDTGRPGTPTLATYRSLLGALPTKQDWDADCRSGIQRVQRWLDTNPDWRSYDAFQRVPGMLQSYCLRSLEAHARRLERGMQARMVPPEVIAFYRSHRCLDDSTTLTSANDAVDGHFTESHAPQWAFICPRANDWQLLVVVLDSTPRTIELVRMVGHAWSWLIRAVPAEYFHWVCSTDVSTGRYYQPPPTRDVVLFTALDVHRSKLAFYETPSGWVHARTRYCQQL